MTNLITPRALFSPTYLLNLVKPEIVPFDPPTRKPHPRTKHQVEQMTRRGDGHLKFPQMRGRSLVGRRSTYTDVIYSSSLLRNVAREE